MGLFRRKPAASVPEEQVASLRGYVEEHLSWYRPKPKPDPQMKEAVAEPASKPRPSDGVKYSLPDPEYDLDEIKDIRRFLSNAQKDAALFDHPVLQKAYHEWEKKNAVTRSFSSEVVRMIKELEIKPSDFYKEAGIDKRVFHTMKKDYLYKPSKETAFRCCAGLKLSYEETAELLKLAGYSLSPSDSRELVLRFCLENRIYDIFSINCLLEAMGEKELK